MPPRPADRPRLLVAVAIAALALNLRPVVNSVGSLLPEIRDSLRLSATTAGALTSLPPLCFALLGLAAPVLAGRFRPHIVVFGALTAMTAGQLVRVIGASVPLLFGGSLLALAGLALCNVLLPSLIRRYFPTRIGTMTAVYTTSLAIGATSSSAFSIPIERGLGGDWRAGLGSWGVAAGVALVPWVLMLREHRRGRIDGRVGAAPPGGTVKPVGTVGAVGTIGATGAVPVRRLLRSRLAWFMSVFFGLQAAQAYIVTSWLAQILVDSGIGERSAGYAVGVFAGLGIPGSALIPALLGRQSRLPVIVSVLGGCYLAGYLGLLLNPAGGMWAWAVLIGVGSGTFPLVLTLIAIRARTPEGVAALSAFTQSVGYLIAAAGPVAIGALHDVAGGWSWPILTLMVSAVMMVGVGLQVARPQVVEDGLRTG